MAITSVTLMDPVSGISIPISPQDGVVSMSLDVQPTPRRVTEERVGSAGINDTTAFLSACAVTLSMRLWTSQAGQSPENFLDLLGQLLNPYIRPYLIVTNDQWPDARQFTVRFDSAVKTLDNPVTWDVAISWVAVNGVWEDATLKGQSIPAILTVNSGIDVSSATESWPYSATNAAPCVFRTTNAGVIPSGSEVVLSGGTAPAGFVNGTIYYVVAPAVSAGPVTSIAPGSNGGTIANIASWSNPAAGVLSVLSDLAFPASGSLIVQTSGTAPAIVNYTGTGGTAGTFTGCTLASGTGTVATGNVVSGGAAVAATFELSATRGGTAVASTSTGGGTVSAGGIEFISGSGLDIAPGNFSGTSLIIAGGNIATTWTATIYGPCVGPKLINDTVGQKVSFLDTQSLTAGQYITLDSRARTAYLNGDPTQSVLNNLDWANSTWWLMQPGNNSIRFDPTSGGGGSYAAFSFRPAWIP